MFFLQIRPQLIVFELPDEGVSAPPRFTSVGTIDEWYQIELSILEAAKRR
jgi:hypothetical protein